MTPREKLLALVERLERDSRYSEDPLGLDLKAAAKAIRVLLRWHTGPDGCCELLREAAGGDDEA